MSQKVMDVINIVVIFFLMNMMWFMGTIIGLGILGLVPSTAALIHMILLPNLFSEGYSYRVLFHLYVKKYLETIKKYHFKLLLPSVFIFIFYIDLIIIQRNNLMKSLFQWPIVLLIGYLILSTINFFILDTKYRYEKNNKKIKFAMTIPLILPFHSLICLILLLCFLVIGVMYSWFFFLATPVFFYAVSHLFIRAYRKKGLVEV